MWGGRSGWERGKAGMIISGHGDESHNIECSHFRGIFVLSELTYLVAVIDRQLLREHRT